MSLYTVLTAQFKFLKLCNKQCVIGIEKTVTVATNIDNRCSFVSC